MIRLKKKFFRTRQGRSFLFKKSLIISIMIMMVLGFIGGKSYLNHSLQKWCQEQKVHVEAEKWALGWGSSPKLIFKNVKLHNQVHSASLQNIHVDELGVEVKLTSLLKSYFQAYDIFINAQGVTIEEENKSDAKIKKIHFHCLIHPPIYKMIDLESTPIHIRLSPPYTTPPKNDEPQPFFAPLSLPSLGGTLEFHETQKTLDFKLRMPPFQSPSSKTISYDVNAQGTLHFLEGHFPVSPHKIPLPLKGQVTFTINHFSHFLNHLNQARIISTVVDNLGSTIGYPISKEDIRSATKEIFTNAVTLHLHVQPGGAFLGGFKIYP